MRQLLYLAILGLIFINCTHKKGDKNELIEINTLKQVESKITIISDSSKINYEAEKYSECINRIHSTRDSLYKSYLLADSSGRDSIISVARQFLFISITQDIFSFWYGTPWEFYGQTRIPRQGTIACGYFVTAILCDAGFNIPNEKWAQLASETVILKMSSDIKRYRNKPVEDISKYIAGRENGLYLVGLDCHVGFIYKNNESIQFVHSNYYQPSIGVMSEDLDTKNPLNDSKYRVIGRLFDDNMIIKWLTKTRIE